MVPLATEAASGEMSRDETVAEVTVSVVLPLVPPTPPSVASMTVAPAVQVLTRPLVPGVLLTVAMAVEEDVQVTVLVTSAVDVSE